MPHNFGVQEPQLSPSLQVPLPQLPQSTPPSPPPGASGIPQGFADINQAPPEQPQPPQSPEELEQRTSGWEKFLEVLANPAITQSLLTAGAEILKPRAPGTSDISRIASGAAAGGQQFLEQSAVNAERERLQQATDASTSLAESQGILAESTARLREEQASVVERETASNEQLVTAAISRAEADNLNAAANMLRAENDQSLVQARIAHFESLAMNARAQATTAGEPGPQEKLINNIALSLQRTGIAQNPDTARLLALQFVQFNQRSKSPAEFELEALKWANDAKFLLGRDPSTQKAKDSIDDQVAALIKSFEGQTGGLDINSTNVPRSPLNSAPPPPVDSQGRPLLTANNAGRVKTQPDGSRWQVTRKPDGTFAWEPLGP